MPWRGPALGPDESMELIERSSPTRASYSIGDSAQGARRKRFFGRTSSKSCGWRPFSLRPLYLIAVACLALALFATVEALREISVQNQGLVFFTTTDDISPSLFFAYNYAPTVVAVAFSLLWSFSELSVQRLEPYYQLCKPGGAPANVLFLDYAFEFSLLIPYTAARRKQWTVCYVSTISLLVSLFLPALQSSLLGINEITISGNVSLPSWPGFVSATHQSVSTSREIVNGVDAILAAGNSPPIFATRNITVTPVDLGYFSENASETWTMDLPVYWTEPSCVQVSLNNIFPGQPKLLSADRSATTVGWNLSNILLPASRHQKKGCLFSYTVTTTVPNANGSTQAADWAQITNNQTDWIANGGAYVSKECNSVYDFVATLITINGTGPGHVPATIDPGSTTNALNYTSSAIQFACKPLYLSATAQVVVLAANGTVVSVDLSNQPGTEIADSQFNAHVFGNILTGAKDTGDLPEYLNSSGDIGPMIFGHFPVNSGINFQTVLQDILPTSGPAEKGDFKTAIKAVFQQAFVLTTGALFNRTGNPTMVQASGSGQLISIAVTQVSAILSEVLLALVVLTSVFLIFHYRNRESLLRSDPDSVAAVCGLVADLFRSSNILMDPSKELDRHTTQELLDTVQGYRLHLRDSPDGKVIEFVSPNDGEAQPSGESAHMNDSSRFLGRSGFLSAVTLFLLLVVGSAILYSLGISRGGYAYLTDSKAFASQALWSFVPTVFSTLIGIIWSSTQRDLSMLQPWVALQKGMAKAAESLSLNYSSKPPISSFFTSLRKGHWILSVASFACLASILLNIITGQLFTQTSGSVHTSSTQLVTSYSSASLTPNSSSLGLNPIFELLRTNITRQYNFPMQPWTSDKYAFWPVARTNGLVLGNLYSAVTTGIGASLVCTNHSVAEHQNLNQTTEEWFWDWSPSTDTHTICTLDVSGHKSQNQSFAQSIYFLSLVGNGDGSERIAELCSTTSMLVVEQWNTTASADVTDQNTVSISCTPQISMQNFTVVFDNGGHIRSYTPLNNTSIGPGAQLANATAILAQFHSAFISSSFTSSGYGGGGVSPYDWPGLLTARLHQIENRSTSLLDPDVLYNTSSQIYGRTFSTYFSQYRDSFLEHVASPSPAANALVYVRELRMIPYTSLFALVFAILAFYILAMALIYFAPRRRRRHGNAARLFAGPRLPNSLGTLVPWVAHSRMLRDFEGTHAMSARERDAFLRRLDRRYRFGEFVGGDGLARLALDEEVVPGGGGEIGVGVARLALDDEVVPDRDVEVGVG